MSPFDQRAGAGGGRRTLDGSRAEPAAALGRRAPASGSARGRESSATSDTVPWTLRIWAAWAWRFLVIVAALWVVGQVAGALTFVLVAVFVGFVICSLVLPLVDLVGRLLPRGLAVAISLVAFAAVVVGILTFIARSFMDQIPQLGPQVSHSVQGVRDWLSTGSPVHVDPAQIDVWLKSAQGWLAGNAGTVASSALGGVGTVGQMLTGLGLAVFASIFFLYDGAGMWSWLLGLTPPRARTRLDTSGMLAWTTFSAYARGTVTIAFTNAVLVGIGLLVLRVPLAVPLALLVFFGTFIPYVGAPFAMIVAALVAFTANGPLSFLLVVVMIAAIGQIEGNVLQPMIMSKQVALHPLVIIVSVTAGSVSAGIIGAVVAVPIVSVVWVIVRYLTGRDAEHPLSSPWPPETGSDTAPIGTAEATDPG